MTRPATAYRHSFADDEDSCVTQVVPLAMPCRSIVGCSAPSVPGTGRCRAHQPSAPVRAESREQLTRRLVAELLQISAVRRAMRAQRGML